MTDSYNAIKASVQDQVKRVRIKREHYVDVIMTTDTYMNEDHKAIRISITKDLRELDKDLKVFIAGVEQIEKNRAKFIHIKDAELAAGRKAANETKTAVDEIKASINSAEIRKKIDGDEQTAKRRADSLVDNSGSGSGVSTIESENDGFIGDQQKQVKAQIEEQDKVLDQIGAGLDRLQETGREINQELKIQDKMLDKLDDDLDDAGKKMGVVMKNLSKVLQTKDTFQIAAVIVMILILAGLIALLLWT